MRFCGHVPNSPRNKNLKRLIPYLLEKVVFLDPKRLLSPSDRGKKTFSSTLNVMIWQMIRNESVRLVGIKTKKLATRSYGWKYQNWFKFCIIWLAFKRGCLEAILSNNTFGPLEIKTVVPPNKNGFPPLIHFKTKKN
jgi:hypothetical protein